MRNHRRVLIFAIALLFSLITLGVNQASIRAQSTINADELELGSRLYAENCAVCHGISGQGRIGATLDKNWPSIKPDATIRTTINQGIPGSTMQAFGKSYGGPFNETEIDALVSYILSWQTTGIPDPSNFPTPTTRPPISPIPDVKGDPNRGAILYDQNCAMCHGVNGEGRVGTSLSKNWPSIRPDLTVRATIAQGIPGTTMQAFSQTAGGPLTENQIDDITAYVMTLPSAEASGPVAEATPESTESSPFTGFTGVLVTAILLILIIVVILWVQRQRGTNEKSRD